VRRFGILHVCCCDGGGWRKTFVMVMAMALRIYLVGIGMNRDAEISRWAVKFDLPCYALVS